MKFSSLIAILVVSVISTSCGSPELSGKWTGKTEVDPSVLPTGLSPERQQLVDQMVETMRKSEVTLDLRSDLTYTMTSRGVIKLVPNPTGLPGFTAETRVTTGTWKQAGETLNIQVQTLDGQPVEPHGQTLTISKDGKSMTYIPPPTGRNNGDSKVVFKRS